MLCEEFEERLPDYLDGTLDAERGRAAASHAAGCSACEELLNDVVRSTELVRAADDIPAPPPALSRRLADESARVLAG